jgi:hypothetical protein
MRWREISKVGRYMRRRPSAIPANGYAGNADGLRTEKPGREGRFLGNALWRQVLLALPSAMVIWGAEEPLLCRRSFELRENALGDRHQVLPGRGKLDVPRVATEEPTADRVLDLANGATERRLRYVENPPRLREAPQLGDAEEDLKLVQGQLYSHKL